MLINKVTGWQVTIADADYLAAAELTVSETAWQLLFVKILVIIAGNDR